MADRTYTFIIRNETGRSRGAKTPVAGETAQPATPQATTEKVAQDKNGAAALALVAVNQLQPFVTNYISHELSKVELETGSREYSQKLQFTFSVGTELFDIGKTVFAGTILGGGFGALIGLGVGGAKKAIDIAQTADTLNIQRIIEDRTLGLRARRTGTDGSR